MRNKIILMIIITIFVISAPLYAAYLRNMPVTLTQPNGDTINVFATGDEFNHYFHDANGYSIIKNPNTGVYEYAVLKGDDPVASGFSVGEIDPISLGVQKHIKYSDDVIRQRSVLFENRRGAGNGPNFDAPTSGTINNIVVFIRFSDESANVFSTSPSVYGGMFNNTAAGANSMYNYYKEVSNNQLTINTAMYPTQTGSVVVSYQDTQARSYFQPYSASNTNGYHNDTEHRDREFALLQRAIASVDDTILASGLNIDSNDDGYVDNVCFIVSGAPNDWADLLWPHQWSIYSITVNIGTKRVYDFNFQLEASLNSSGVGVLCHEMFHSLGAPDLYHYSDQTPYVNMTPVGPWDIMQWDSDPPQHMTMYMKYKYGDWVTLSDLPEITTSGTYTVYVNTDTNSSHTKAYRIASPNSPSQYFMVELRKKGATGSFEDYLPTTGIIVYRINPAYTGNANSKDELYVYRPNGTATTSGTVGSNNAVWFAAYHQTVNGGGVFPAKTAINDTTNPRGWLANYVNPNDPATWAMEDGGLNISNINIASDGLSATFTVTIPSAVRVISPNGSEQIGKENKTAIVWEDSISENVSIKLYKGGSELSTIIASTESDGYYEWDVPDTLVNATDYRIVITSVTDSTKTDESDADFSIGDAVVSSYIVPNGAVWGYASVYLQSNVVVSENVITLKINSASTEYSVSSIDASGKLFRSSNTFNMFRFTNGNHVIHVYNSGVEVQTLLLSNIEIYPGARFITGNMLLHVKEGTGNMLLYSGDTDIDSCLVKTTNKPFTIAFENASTKRIEIANPYGKKGALLRYDNNSWILVDHSVDNLVIRKAGTYVVVNDVNNVMIPVIRSNELAQNYPNPFNPSTEIPVKLVESSDIVLTVFDAKGREVIVLAEGRYEAGLTRIPWNGRDKRGNEVPSGVYYYRLTVNGKSFTKKMIMLK